MISYNCPIFEFYCYTTSFSLPLPFLPLSHLPPPLSLLLFFLFFFLLLPPSPHFLPSFLPLPPSPVTVTRTSRALIGSDDRK